MSNVEFKFGCDPEFFLRDKTNGQFVSAHGMIPGTKHSPLQVEGGAVQVDGMALEFNIDPVTNVDDWNKNIDVVLHQLREMIDDQLEFVFEPVAHFGKEYIDSQPKIAKELGCEPDYNAYTGLINPKPNADLGFRTASGHIHVGWTEQQDVTDSEHIEACHMLIKQLDIFLALPSVAWDLDEIRSTMYGKWGAYRPKHYGVEYRTLSNAWLTSPIWRNYVFNQAKIAAERLLAGEKWYSNYGKLVKNHEWKYKSVDLISHALNLPHYDPFDFSSLSDRKGEMIFQKIERPSIKERFRLIEEEFYFYHKESGSLKPYEEVSPNTKTFTHPNESVRYHKRIGNPKSSIPGVDAMKIEQPFYDIKYLWTPGTVGAITGV
jgi:hypothetical protein